MEEILKERSQIRPVISVLKENPVCAGSRELSEATLSDYIKLMKPGVISLVAFTGFVGAIAAPVSLSPVIVFLLVLCIVTGAGAAGALNMWYEADIDSIMKRTATRPLPSGKLYPDEARDFGIILAFFSILTLGVFFNWFSAGVLVLAILFYVVVYTIWLKRRTPQNIVIGGISGALPPIIGWVAATGELSLESIFLFMVIFLWTPPHFWALALLRQEDYERAGLPMMPNVYGQKATKKRIVIYAVLTAVAAVLPVFFGFTGRFYGAGATVLGVGLVFFAWSLLWSQKKELEAKYAKILFSYSLFYLFMIFMLYFLNVLISKY